MEINLTLDVRGESCPYPVIYTLEALEDMEKGAILQVVADCPASFKNVPEEVVKHGYELAKEPEKKGRDLYFYFIAG
ncbi:sulfurtransferase-like selenium metabolism protein YedF [Virgibacillus sp. W0430]|uniref:sulfurtransferase-like selenium metabolism protein YedF n=1 Tax=Virgibacillus sp. W0430 TaxID=3391580 RepID=UPI003F485FEF